MLRHDNPEESRYDSATTDKIIRIASRLDSENRDTLSVSEIEEIAKEVGIEANYVREALRRVAEEKVEKQLGRRNKEKAAPAHQGHSKAEFWSALLAFLIPLVWATVAFFVSGKDVASGKFFTMMAPLPLALLIGFIAGNKKIGFFASLVLVLALWPALDRVMSTKQMVVNKVTPGISVTDSGVNLDIPALEKLKDWGENMGATQDLRDARAEIAALETELKNSKDQAAKDKLQKDLAAAKGKEAKALKQLEQIGKAVEAGDPTEDVTIPPFPPTPGASTVMESSSESNSDLPPLLIFGSLFAGILGAVGAGVRMKHFPFAPPAGQVPETSDRGRMLEQYFELQNKLHGQKRQMAFLSVDVSDSTGMKHGQEELLVEHSFSRYTKWVADIAAQFGGEVQAAAGDGVMCAFPTPEAAVRAAITLQKSIGQFNSEHNRLPVPFRIRCGLSSGEVPWEPGTPIGLLQSPVIDRAASMQKLAEPESIVFSQEVAQAAQAELGPLQSNGFTSIWRA